MSNGRRLARERRRWLQTAPRHLNVKRAFMTSRSAGVTKAAVAERSPAATNSGCRVERCRTIRRCKHPFNGF